MRAAAFVAPYFIQGLTASPKTKGCMTSFDAAGEAKTVPATLPIAVPIGPPKK
jgi:hypothetical protein